MSSAEIADLRREIEELKRQLRGIAVRAAAPLPHMIGRVVGKTGHGLALGDPLKPGYEKATSAEDLIIGIVAENIGSNAFVFAQPGSVLDGFSGVSAGEELKVDEATTYAIGLGSGRLLVVGTGSGGGIPPGYDEVELDVCVSGVAMKRKFIATEPY